MKKESLWISLRSVSYTHLDVYKRQKNMFALLGKPGFEELGAELNARL